MPKNSGKNGINGKLKDDSNLIWHPFTQLVDGWEHLLITSGKGPYLYTEDGREILDAISSWWVNLHGHSHPYIAEKVAEQAANLEHVIFAGFTHEPAIELARNLLSILPENQKKIFYSDDGSTSVEVALKMAFQFWYNQGIEKTKIIAMDGSYHGDTFGAMSVGDRGPFSAPFTPFLFEVDFIDFPSKGLEDKVLEQFKILIGREKVASFIFEPLIQGAAGMRTYSKELLDEMIRLAREKDIICIADEVMTGFGRTGKLFASDFLENKPDIICLSKGLTGGTMALGATSCTEEIISVFRSSEMMKTFFHGHSFTANPIACAAANASWELLMELSCRKSMENISKYHEKFAEEVKEHPDIRETRLLGTILALELYSVEDTHYANELRHKLYPFFLDRNVLLRPLGNVIYILPPYVCAEKDLDKAYNVIRELLDRP